MKKLVIALCALAAASVQAGVKYWDNPAFKAYDADAYVQDGLVLNFDGIRNQGLDQPHSYNATTWVNLANPGTQDLTKGGTGKNSRWLDDGYFFDGTNWFGNTGLTIASPYETECLVDANCSDHVAKKNIGYVFFTAGDDNKNWTKWSLAIRNSTTDGVWFNTHYYTSDRPKIKNTDAFTFLTMIANGTYAAIFSGLTEPTGATGRYGLKSGTTSIGSFTSDGWGIGGNPGGGTQQLIGTIKSFRHYSRVLSLEERTWNRAVDNSRFFGTAPLTEIAETNAVIASAVDGLSICDVPANEPNGCYAVDAAGYTFTAPATTNVNGRTYTCTGYTHEEWDSATGDWGTPVLQSGVLAAPVAASDRVRITWQWTAGDGIVTRYTPADYVQNGLVLHYDGIRNVGADLPHSSDTTTWKNLAPDGGWDMAFNAKSGVTKPGEWRADGYRFEQQSWFTPGTAITLPSNQTVQIAVEANGLDQEVYLDSKNNRINESYLWYNAGTFNKGGSISLRRDDRDTGNEFFDWTTHGYSTATGNAISRPAPCQPNGTPLRYVTTVLADDYTAAFIGTSIPTTTSANRFVTGAVRMALTSTPQVQTASGNGFYIGGLADNTLRKFCGTIHNFRFYNRVLTNEELVQNRVIDDYRFHGVMPVTNVIVATSHSFLAGNERNGNYEISGSYTFSASAETRTDSRGFSYDFKGYTLEAWDAATQGWSAPVSYESGSYTYAVATSPAKVRLTWVWEASGNLRTAADYGLSDYVSSGLVLHYDGIKNIGEESADVSNPTSAWSRAWANLVDPGAFTLSRQNKSEKAGVWDTDGFAFVNLNATTGSWFQCNTPLHLPPAHTFQFLADARVADQHNASCAYLMFNEEWQKCSLAVRTASDYSYGLYYVPDTTVGDSSGYTRPKLLDTGDTNSKYTYATAIIDGRKAMLFAGTDYPTDNPNLKTSQNAATAQTLTKIGIGGRNAGSGTQDFNGKIKSIRYYDRVLTPDEMVRNRQVDSARYFGELAFTNVVVAVGEGLDVTATPAPGAYAVEGAYTFSAAAGNDTPNAYKLEEWDAATGAWTNGQVVESLSYTYDAATSPAMVRVTWRKTNPFVIVVR